VNHAPIVSFDDEPLILVDEQNRVKGYLDKAACHVGDGILHRAFSIFLFDRQGRLLMQKRADSKLLWGGYWSNTVCSHPRKGEDEATATARRLADELHTAADLTYLFRFQYQARFGDVGSENELCAVYAGLLQEPYAPNPTEIAATRLVEPAELDRWLEDHPEELTPWFRMEWQRIRADHWQTVLEMADPLRGKG